MKLETIAKAANKYGLTNEILPLTSGDTGLFIYLEKIVEGRAVSVDNKLVFSMTKYLERYKVECQWPGDYKHIMIKQRKEQAQ